MKELQNELKQLYKEIGELKLERNKWKEQANKTEDKELRFDLNIEAQKINEEIRDIKIKMKEIFEKIIDEESE